LGRDCACVSAFCCLAGPRALLRALDFPLILPPLPSPPHPQLDAGYISSPQSIEFPTAGGKTAFMNFYLPRNKDFELPPGQLPALLVKIHGGARRGEG
jgi:hypothetical protein